MHPQPSRHNNLNVPTSDDSIVDQEFSLDLESLTVEELEQRLELQSIGVLFDSIGPNGGDSCTPTGCGWR